MSTQGLAAEAGGYAERVPAREPLLDRFAAAIAFRLGKRLRRALPDPAPLAEEVRRRAARLHGGRPADEVPALRYRLRRDGWRQSNLLDCLALCSVALGAPPAPALAAAAALLRGTVVDAADPATRESALALAALSNAILGVPVHLIAATPARAARLFAAVEAPAQRLGLAASRLDPSLEPPARRIAYKAAIACVAAREVGFDFLRDRVRSGARARALRGLLERLAGDAPDAAELLLPGLHCALVEDADAVLLDDAAAPLVISAESDAGAERLLYEQALELARALAPEADFALDGARVALTAEGSERLGRMSLLLGPLWSARQRREELVGAALAAVHLVAPGGPPPEDGLVRALAELNERGALAGRRDVLFRTSLPGFFGRYLRLAGVCADARGLEDELWDLYRLRTARAGAPQAPLPLAMRVFDTAAERRQAAVRSALGRAAAGEQAVLAVRSQPEAQALRSLLGAGPSPGVEISVYPGYRDAARAPDPARPLHLVLAELHSRRHAEQIARAFGAASAEQLAAREDKPFAEALGAGLGPAGAWVAERMDEARRVRLAQRALDHALAAERRDLVLRERQLEDLLAFSGRAG